MADIELNLPTVDDLFTTQEERNTQKTEGITDIKTSLIDDFPNHPFKVKHDSDMEKLAESIKDHGVLVPVILRPKGNGRYEMIAGHRRKFGSEKADKDSVPSIVRDLTDDEATIIMVDSNLQRENILPSERAYSYKMKLEALKRQGKRTDLTSAPLEPKLRSNEQLAKDSSDSVSQIKRYIRLTELIPEIMDMVDDNKIAFRPAVELSYLSHDEQQSLLKTMEIDEVTPSLAQAIKMKQFSQDKRLNEDVILSIMSEEKPNQIEQFKIPRERIRKYFPEGTPKEKIEDTIVKALEEYKRKRDRADSR